LTCIGLLAMAGQLSAQSYRQQGIYPVFDGWEELPDGSKLIYFGYMNRHANEVTIPLGPDNSFEQQPADRMQPTHFLPGRHEHVFTVKVPKDFSPTAKLVWSLKSAVGVQKATASLNQLYILEVEEEDPGTPHLPPPAIRVTEATTKVGTTLALAPRVTAEVPKREAVIEGSGARQSGVSVTWNMHRGPGQVTFSQAPGAPAAPRPGGGRGRPEAPPTPGLFSVPCGATVQASCGAAQVRFSAPGEYLLRAVAHQGREQSDALMRVTVTP
jgi:hypothetical protein